MTSNSGKALRHCLILISGVAAIHAVTIQPLEGASRIGVTRSHMLTNSCLTPNDFATDFRNYVSDVATGTDSESVTLRGSWNIPAVADSQIVFVTDSATCARAAYAHAIAAEQDTTNPPAVFLFRIGVTRYAAFNGKRVGEFLMHYVFDSSFVLIAPIG